MGSTQDLCELVGALLSLSSPRGALFVSDRRFELGDVPLLVLEIPLLVATVSPLRELSNELGAGDERVLPICVEGTVSAADTDRIVQQPRHQANGGSQPLLPFATLFGSLANRGVLTRILVMPETMSLAAVKARFSEIVDRVERQQDRVVVTRNGRPAAVLISAEDLESLEETLAVMSDRSVAAQIRDSQEAVAAGEPGVSLSELRAGLEHRRKRVK